MRVATSAGFSAQERVGGLFLLLEERSRSVMRPQWTGTAAAGATRDIVDFVFA